jgi:hypothetical protein
MERHDPATLVLPWRRGTARGRQSQYSASTVEELDRPMDVPSPLGCRTATELQLDR